MLAVAVVFKRLKAVEGDEKGELFSLPILGKIVVIAVPSILQQGSISVGNIIIQSVINGFGPGVMAGYSAAVKMNNLVITSFTTLGNGIFQLHRPERGRREAVPGEAGLPCGREDGVDAEPPAVCAVLLCGAVHPAVLHQSAHRHRHSDGRDLPAHSVALLLSSFRPSWWPMAFCGGAGMMNKFMIATFADLILRVILAIALAKTAMGATGIWCAWPVGWCTAAVLSIGFYRTGAWKNDPVPETGSRLMGEGFMV